MLPLTSTKLNLANCLLLDDDALSEICLELRDRVRKGSNIRLRTFTDAETQTDLHVEPHILEDEQVASVIADSAVQTNTVQSFGSLPPAGAALTSSRSARKAKKNKQ